MLSLILIRFISFILFYEMNYVDPENIRYKMNALFVFINMLFNQDNQIKKYIVNLITNICLEDKCRYWSW